MSVTIDHSQIKPAPRYAPGSRKGKGGRKPKYATEAARRAAEKAQTKIRVRVHRGWDKTESFVDGRIRWTPKKTWNNYVRDLKKRARLLNWSWATDEAIAEVSPEIIAAIVASLNAERKKDEEHDRRTIKTGVGFEGERGLDRLFYKPKPKPEGCVQRDGDGAKVPKVAMFPDDDGTRRKDAPRFHTDRVTFWQWGQSALRLGEDFDAWALEEFGERAFNVSVAEKVRRDMPWLL